MTTAGSTDITTSTERTGSTGDPGGSTNNLARSGSASFQTTLPALGKVIVGTSVAATAGSNVAIGEKVQYQVTVTIPDGTTANTTLTNSLPAGLAIVSLHGLAYSSAFGSSQAGGFAGVQSSATVGADGSSLSLNFGTIINSNRDTTRAQTIGVTYMAVVLNVAANVAGHTLTDSAVLAVQGGATAGSTPVTVVEPHATVTVASSPARGDAYGLAITFTAVISAASGAGADADDLAIADALPNGFAYVPGRSATPWARPPPRPSTPAGSRPPPTPTSPRAPPAP